MSEYTRKLGADLFAQLVDIVAQAGSSSTKRRNGIRNAEGKLLVPGYEDLAIRTCRQLEFDYTGDDGKPQYVTIIKTHIPELKKEIRVLYDRQEYDLALRYGLKTTLENFCTRLSRQFTDINNAISQEYKKEVAENKADQKIFDISKALVGAYETLERVAKGQMSIDWCEVSCALALVTGRRQAEIHATAEFFYLDPFHVTFKGQLKARDEELKAAERAINQLREIPVLVPANLVVSGLQWLGDAGRRITDGPGDRAERAHDAYARPLSRYLKKPGIAIFEGQTYKNYRSLYVAASYRNAIEYDRVPPMHIEELGRQVLGHSEGDLGTIASYKPFELAKESLSRYPAACMLSTK